MTNKTPILFTLTVLLATTTSGADWHTLEHQGQTRKYRVHRGAAATERPPVVLVFHGGGGDVESMVQMSDMDRVADARGFLAVYPAGTGRFEDRFLTWNAGSCCGSAHQENVDDVGFVNALIDDLVKRYDIDLQRVYATGHSNGAQMSYRLACELADRIAAIAPNASQSVFAGCHPSRQVPVLHFHGSADRCAKFEGGTCGGCFQRVFQAMGLPSKEKTWACAAVEPALMQVAERNGCTIETTSLLEKGAMHCRAFKGCAAETHLCIGKGAGHTCPGSHHRPDFCRRRPDGRLCAAWSGETGATNHDVDASDMMWEFFSRHPLPNSQQPPKIRPRAKARPENS